MDFDETVSYLLGLGHETVAVKLGLDNVTRLLARLGHPERAFPSVQIAGTNGKGSTAAMLDAVCRAAGLRAGLYTSPHLISITERVRVGGRELSREAFARAATEVRAAAEEVRRESGALATFFEQVTAGALVAFREARVELAILETGMGGRLDATTAAGASLVAVTPVALDHQEYLGGTLAEIASEKAAVVRPGARAVVAPQEPEAERVVLARCRECGVEPRRATPDWLAVEGRCEGGRLRVRLRTGRDDYGGVCLALRGRHQLTNAAAAVALAEALADEGFPLTREAVVAGLERAEHPGRLELDERAAPPVLLDGAHNPAGARALRAYLDEFVAAPVTMVFGAMRDKALAEIAGLLFPAASDLILTEPRSPRAASIGELLRAVPTPTSSSTITLAPSSADALALARARAAAGGLVCVTGSLYLVGEVRGLLRPEA
ncbi:MAG TPA: folylpolyglutamate synthase/dihydrofolate synthase family protein [Pyrinomonadaceae bacterium]|nr:folylpolyglutamate synthase/dihydrofolate synthase family protein [Pyrinomonadaceae bacterium]